MQIRAAESFLGYHCKPGACGELFYKPANVGHEVSRNARFGKHVASHFGVATLGREDHGPFRDVRRHSAAFASNLGWSSTNSGTPRSTPWKPISGSPRVIPSLLIWYSRIVSS